MENRSNRPVVPLPNPGEGGPVLNVGDRPGGNPPGSNSPGNNRPGSNRPGGNAPGSNRPGNNRPGSNFPGSNRPENNRPGSNFPGNNPPGNSRPGGNPPSGGAQPTPPGGGIQLLPGSVYPPVSDPYAAVRFLNATSGYPPFRISVGSTVAVRLLDAGNATGYLRVPSGQRTITVSGLDGYIYLRQRLRFPAGSASTVTILNRAGGLSLRLISDNCPAC